MGRCACQGARWIGAGTLVAWGMGYASGAGTVCADAGALGQCLAGGQGSQAGQKDARPVCPACYPRKPPPHHTSAHTVPAPLAYPMQRNHRASPDPLTRTPAHAPQPPQW